MKLWGIRRRVWIPALLIVASFLLIEYVSMRGVAKPLASASAPPSSQPASAPASATQAASSSTPASGPR